jgi:hypothetical protein
MIQKAVQPNDTKSFERMLNILKYGWPNLIYNLGTLGQNLFFSFVSKR